MYDWIRKKKKQKGNWEVGIGELDKYLETDV